MRGKQIILGVGGGIAAYKAIMLCSQLTQAGAVVKVVMTHAATQFVQPLSFQAITRQAVYTDTFDEQNPAVIAHIDLADHADLIVIAPATADLTARLAAGMANDMLTTTVLASRAPLWLAPAMNMHMYANPAVQRNLGQLREQGVQIIEPGSGQLACGHVGPGRLAEPHEIAARIAAFFAQEAPLEDWRGRRILITAGGTKERIDPVRYIGNDSSGRMGYALAQRAKARGAIVTLVSASALPTPQGVEVIRVESAEQMRAQVMERYSQQDVLIKAAAVSDYRPVAPASHKLKKDGNRMVIELEENVDILAELGQQPDRPYLVGFAAETERLHERMAQKIAKKNCDLLVGNNVLLSGAGFEGSTNIVSVFDRSGLIADWPILDKEEVADRLLSLVLQRLLESGEGQSL